ncbi:MAG TPA: hypothetical protein VLL52_11460 [Anaerolineae bacterium]|nr:hypothetical protein [Anaerolineae bacterium]
MDELDLIFREFFLQQKSKENPDYKTIGHYENYRAEIFHTHKNVYYDPLDETFLLSLSGDVYIVSYSHITAILALYGSSVLWLDSHNNNEDFEEFIYREQLRNWLPKNESKFLSLLTLTKFNYLGGPQIVQNLSQIPLHPMDAEHPQISIASPTFIYNGKHTHIAFCLWTKLQGKLWKIDCTLKNNKFDYELKLIANGIGDWTALR